MSTHTIDPRNIISSEDFSKEYLKDSKSWQTAYSKLPSSGNYKKPDDREKLILLSYAMNGRFKETLLDVFDKTDSGQARSTKIDEKFKEYEIKFEEVQQATQPVASAEKKVVEKTTDDSPEKKMLLLAIRKEVSKLTGGKSSAEEHFQQEMKDTLKIYFPLFDLGADTAKQITTLSIRSAFTAVLGTLPELSEEAVSEEATDYSIPLGRSYGKKLLAGFPQASGDTSVEKVFENIILTSVATDFGKLTGESVDVVKARLTPHYASAMEDFKGEFFS